jgi:ELWxxDGT repeat protein
MNSKSVLAIVIGAIFFILLIFGCGALYRWINPPATPTSNPALITAPLTLAVQAQPNTYNTVDQLINYNFMVTNSGTSNLPGPVAVTDNKMTVNCPPLNTVGNKNDDLNPTESVICTGQYKITQADISNGLMTNTSTVTVGGQSSNPVNTSIQAQLNNVLTITVTPNPSTYNLAGQNITFTYVIKNTGTTAIGPTQFVVKDSLIPSLINCGSNATTLATNQTVSCTGTYTTTATDATVNQITSTASATTPTGAGTVQPATTSVYNSTMPVTPVSTFVPGTTIIHSVEPGEWMLQISRCYGANFKAVVRANPQVPDPNIIFANRTTLKVPNIGSDGPIYGPPCMIYYTVVSGDTWQSIASKYNADIVVLQAANPGVTLTPGVKIKVPVNSKGGTPVTPVPATVVPTAVPTVIIPTIIPTVPTQVPQPIRLTFPPGSPASVSQPGTITTPGTIRYVFAGTAGQTLNVQLIVPTNDVNMAIYGPNNVTLKAPDATPTWAGSLATTGDYYIDLISSMGNPSKTFTLNLTLTTPSSTTNAERVADINPGPTSSNPSWLSPFGSQLYFQANGNSNTGQELWRYDRGSNVATMVADIYPGPTGSLPTSLRPYQNMLYFGANGNDGAGNELWRFNGSAWGRANDLFPGEGSSNPMYMTEYNGELYFSANGNDGHGVELWKFNGTTSATTLAADINPGAGSSNPSYLAVYNNMLYFAATTTDGGTELWKFDGTNATLASDIAQGATNSNPAFLTVFNNLLYFSANGGNGAGTELWKFDGTTATMAADINPGPADSAPTYLTPYNNALFFGAVGNSSGFELWKFDGTTASMAADINPAGSANPAFLSVYNNELYFQATGNDNAGAELWRYKGQ